MVFILLNRMSLALTRMPDSMGSRMRLTKMPVFERRVSDSAG